MYFSKITYVSTFICAALSIGVLAAPLSQDNVVGAASSLGYRDVMERSENALHINEARANPSLVSNFGAKKEASQQVGELVLVLTSSKAGTVPFDVTKKAFDSLLFSLNPGQTAASPIPGTAVVDAAKPATAAHNIYKAQATLKAGTWSELIALAGNNATLKETIISFAKNFAGASTATIEIRHNSEVKATITGFLN